MVTAVLVAGVLLMPALAQGHELRVPGGDFSLMATARAVAQKVRKHAELTVTLLADERAALRPKTDCALVRATAARQAFEGTDRYDAAHASLRTVAILGKQVIHALARPERATWPQIKDRPVVLRTGDAETLRAVLGFADLGLAAVVPVATDDPLAAARAGQVDAWFEVSLADSPTAAALLAMGWKPLTFKPEQQLALLDKGWPLEMTKREALQMAGAGEVLTVPVALVCDASVPRAVIEDVVDALFAPVDALAVGADPTAVTAPLLAQASRKTAALPVPTALHAGAAASYERYGPLNGPIEVQVTLWMLDISAIDVAHHTFDADFTIELRWQDARLDVDTVQPFEIMNASEFHPTAYYYVSMGKWHTKNWRVQAKLRGHFDLSRFPFDRQRLTVDLEHPLLSAEELVYRCETRFGSQHVDLRRDRLGPDLVFGAWKFAKVSTEEITSTYGQDENYSRYRFVIDVERSLLPFLVQVVGPMLLLLLMAWSASWIPHEKIDAKLLLTVLALVVAVELQVAAAEHAGELSYPTLTEYLYLFTYLSIALAVVQSIIEYRLHDQGDDPAALRLRNRGRVLSILVFVLPTLVVLVGRLR